MIVLVMTIHHFENKEYEKYLETGRKLTKADGVSKSRGKYYAFCPKCGRRCANPQIIKENSHINTCIFQCYSCNKDFEKQFDSRILK
ncbi:MAG: hypothetical protein K2L10_04880 [Ruminococcus sp.]|nr:hypothetical protein [Ruminococcus sp.]